MITNRRLQVVSGLKTKEQQSLPNFRWFLLALPLVLLLSSLTLRSQTQIFSRDHLEYVVEFPSSMWQPVSGVGDYLEFIYADAPANGRLRLRKRLVDAGSSATELFARDEKWELQSLPGYVVCCDGKGAEVGGRLRGTVFSYQYIRNGRPMDGRIYYMQVNGRTFYTLHFTVSSDKLKSLEGQMEFIARKFHLK